MNDTVSNYVDQFNALSPSIDGEPSWIQQQRKSAMGFLRQSGFPGPRDEDWRYTPLRPLVGKPFTAISGRPESGPDFAPFALAGLESHRLVFVDGLYSSHLSTAGELPEGVEITTLADAISSGDAESLSSAIAEEATPEDGFHALNMAFARDGFLVSVGDDVDLSTVLEFVFLSAGEGNAAQARNVLRMGRHARARVLERHVSMEGVRSMVNLSTRLVLDAGADLDYHIVETGGDRVSMINDLEADLGPDSNLRTITTTLGGEVVRNNLKVRLIGSGAHCDMLGMYAGTGRQHIDNHTGVIHAVPHCTSRELYKGVLDKRSRGVFHGRIRVDQGAVKTDATQANNNLLLSPDAEIDTKPQLEIYADDVKCAHGATVGQLDETALFYLRSRGIDEPSARSLLTFAFVNDVLGDVTIEAVRELLESELSRRLISHE